MLNTFRFRVHRIAFRGVGVRKPLRCRIAAAKPLLTALFLPIALGADLARAQLVESIFVAGASSDGYYVANGSTGRLDVAVLIDLRDERPITLGARIEVLVQ